MTVSDWSEPFVEDRGVYTCNACGRGDCKSCTLPRYCHHGGGHCRPVQREAKIEPNNVTERSEGILK
jgi:hypothetical protein